MKTEELRGGSEETRAGEPERGAMEPANFGGAGAFLNISAEPELEPQKFY